MIAPMDHQKAEDLTVSYSRDLRLGSFLETLLGSMTREARVEVLYYNHEQATLDQIDHIGFNATLDGLRVRSIMKVREKGDFEGAGICAYVALTGESVLSPHVKFDRRYCSLLRDDATQSELAVPIKLAEKVIGVLNFEADVPRAFGNSDLNHVQNQVPLLAVMLEYETFRKEEDLLRETLPCIAALADPEDILVALLGTVLKVLGADSLGCVMVPVGDPADFQVLRVVVNRGLTRLKVDQRLDLAALGVIRRACLSSHGQCFWSSDEGEEGYVSLSEGIRSEFATVLRIGERVIAVLDVESAQQVISERYGRVIQRLCDYGAALIYGLEKNSEAERKKEQETVLRAMTHEVHNATGMFGLLMRDLASRPALKEVDRNLGLAIQERLSAMNRLVVGYMSPPQRVRLAEVIHDIQKIARQLGVDLELNGDFDAEVLGTRIGFGWLFENLILNTRKHGEWKEVNRAWLVGEIVPGGGVIRYWDDRQGPPSLILNGRTDRQGFSLIQALCKQYGWEVDLDQHPNGSLRYEFRFTPLDGEPEE